jgi:2-haloacid dehalogenase
MTEGPTIDTIVFDVGNVLVGWDVRAMYRTLFEEDSEMERFLTEVWTPAHNARCDRGEPFAVVIEEVVAHHPHHEHAIRAARERWIETITGPVEGADELVAELQEEGYRLLGLSNFAAETFPLIREEYPVFDRLEHIVISGEVGFVKPEAEIFHVLRDDLGVDLPHAVFVDDAAVNVEGALAVGMHALVFTDVPALRRDLAALRVRVAL